MASAPDPSNPRIDLHVKLEDGSTRVLIGTPTAGATLGNLVGAAPFPEGVAKEDVTIVLVPAGKPETRPSDEVRWIEWHAIGQRDLIWQAQLALGDSDAAIAHARTAYVDGDIEIDEFERRLDSILLAA